MLDAVVQFGELRVSPSLGLQRVFFFVFFKAFLLLFFMYLFIFFYRWLVQAWALFKGKFREGIDKPDPPTWKTRLRCALNKSNDFEELVERSQLDISDPYKVYRIVPEGAKKSQSHTKTHIDRFKQMILQHHSEPKWGNLSGNSLNTHLTAQCSENHQWRSHCIMGFFILRLDFKFCSSVLHAGPRQEDSPLSPMGYQVHPSYPALQTQVNFIHMEMKGVGFRESERERGWMWNRNSGRRDKRCMHGRALIQSQVYESQVSLMPSSAEEEKENHHTGQESVGFVQDTEMWHSGGTNHVKTMLITGDFNLLHGIFVHVCVEKCLTWEFENQLAKYNYANVPGVTQIVGFTSIM